MPKLTLQKIKLEHFQPAETITSFFSKQGSVLPLLTIVLLGLLAVTANVQLQAGSQNLYLAERKFVNSDIQLPARGLFFDRNKHKLTANIAVFSLAIPLRQLTEESKAPIWQSLSEHSKLTETQFDTAWEFATTHKQDLLVPNLDSTQAILLGDELSRFDATITPGSKREYYHGYEMAHIIGYVGSPSEQQVAAGALSFEQVGKYRLENLMQAELRGVEGRSAASGFNTISTVSAQPGNNVVLTIDQNWQLALHNILATQMNAVGGRTAAAMIMDTSNGNILAYANYPSFDPNDFVSGISAEEYAKLLQDKGLPLLDKVAGFQASPGSVFKVVTAYAGLENGVIDENTHIYSNRCISLGAGFPFCEFGKYFLGDLDIKRALTRSSNIFFCQTMLKLSREQGFDKFITAARNLGIGEKTGIRVENEATGVLATPEYKQKTFSQAWVEGDVCNSVIGQGMTNITPLQLAAAMSTISNGGNYYRPNLVLRTEDQEGNVVKATQPDLIRKVPIAPKTQELLLGGLYNAAHVSEGTAYWYLHNAPGNFIAKTGSAEAFENVDGKIVPRVSGWVTGTFDYKGGRYAFAAQIQYGGGGWNVTQVMRRFANCLFSDFKPSCGK